MRRRLLILAFLDCFFEWRAARFSLRSSGLVHSWFYIKLLYQKHFDLGLIDLGDHTRVGQVAFLLGGFLGEDVAVESVLPLDPARPRERETLLGGRIGFHFWHCSKIFYQLNNPQR
jgi:hypothetical protein